MSTKKVTKNVNVTEKLNTISVTAYDTPAVFVRMEQIHISRGRFSLFVSMSANGVDWSEPRYITGGVTNELERFMSKAFDQRVQVVADNEQGYEWVYTGEKMTMFQKYLSKIGLDTDLHLSQLAFEAYNTSEHYEECPFRLFIKENGEGTLTLVDWPAKKRYEFIDPETGAVTTKYTHWRGQDGKIEKIAPENYRRLIVEVRKERQLYVPQQ